MTTAERSAGNRLSDRVAIVTGGAGGIGRSISLSLAAAGAAVAVNHLPGTAEFAAADDIVTEIIATGGRACTAGFDITDEDQVADMTVGVREELGPISIVVCNAATSVAAQRDWRDVSPSEWTQVLDVNVVGAFLCVRAAFDDLVSSGCGSVVVLSSVMPLLGRPGNLHYVTSKAALIGFTRALAREVGPSGVRVNAIAPGAIRTPLEAIYGSEDDVAEQMYAVQSLRRRGLPADVASAITFLASDDASFITGQLLVVDGGWVMH